ncbi:hypothetical protein HOLleu_27252 [Holothuria leucospilota]|uniref:PDZ domain-containing protein n=1 Tax=Holothuria leucospilota TaxID=206669 RepID=A0A9Q1BQ46_HOLLE|nr:hypothetical protein HOLleu_27252 [Holothuria leucospilota]
MIMANVLRRRALYTDAKQAKNTFVSLGGTLEKRQTQEGEEKTYLTFESISAGELLYKSGIRKGDRLISVNFVPVSEVLFDMLIETIRGLTPLILHVERTSHDDTVVTIVFVMNITADQNDEPYLKFHGVYFTKDTESFRMDTIFRYISIHVEPMVTYHYDSSESNVTFIGHQDNGTYWLTVDDTNVKFKKHESSKAVFTMYKYNSNDVHQKGTPVILVPQENSSQCLAATSSNDLTLKSFEETYWTYPSVKYTPNERFLLLVEISHNKYKIESSTVAGQYIAKGSDNEAIMSSDYFRFTVHGGNN